MKKAGIFFIIAIAALMTSVATAGETTTSIGLASGNDHKINEYKYLCVQDLGNQYGIEDKLTNYFKGKNVELLTPNEVEQLDETDKSLVLFASYACTLPERGSANLTVTLRNQDGRIVYSCTKEGFCLWHLIVGAFSPKCEFRKATKKIFRELDETHKVEVRLKFPDFHKQLQNQEPKPTNN